MFSILAKCWKLSEMAKKKIAYFCSLYWIRNKFPFNQCYPNSVVNPDILIISLPKNDKMLVLAKISFSIMFPIFAMETDYIKMHW